MINKIEQGEIRTAMKTHAWTILRRELGQKIAESGNLYEIQEDKALQVEARQLAREIIADWTGEILGSLDEDINVAVSQSDDVFVRVADGE